MAILILDPHLEKLANQALASQEYDRYTEVWNGVTVMSPLPNDEHQELQFGLLLALGTVIATPNLGKVRAGVNVAVQQDNWRQNYRCPDVVVYLATNSAINQGSHWVGGPDFLVEIISEGEDPYAKLDFYAQVKSQEVLLVLRDPWALELYRLRGSQLECVGGSEISRSDQLISETTGLSFQLVSGATRPQIAMLQATTGQRWTA